MASKQQRCNHCGILLFIPLDVQAFKCSMCNGITHVQPTGPLNQAYNSLNHIAGLFRGFMNTITTSSAINSNSGNYGTNHFGYYPRPQPQRPLNPPSPYGSKRAVLCGICYHGRSYRLKGSINDVKCMKYFLIKEFGFPSDSIFMLTDDKEERNPLKIPTKYNIQMALRWLVEGSKSGDSLVFHYSGHGTQEVNMNEIDHSYRPLPFGAKLHAIIDACHSGNVLDLSFVCKMNREGYYTWENHTSSRNYKDTKGGVAICISACEDGQVSVDTSALSGKEVTGALTYSFIQTVQNEPGLTYGHLLSTMRSTIHGTKTGIVTLNGPIASLLNRLLGLRIKQEAQLSSSELFDMYKKQFIL
ncbi:metacaspase-3-like isoform X2 [Vicia villosa]|uniref:metacaspase-3-like isoform X2 n=1 Tax=Vicia villosa TaxID=3911 RepID=UPI00273AF9DB|nr:metacaspase-3-like isoform X2 [Vicia villosa]